MSSTDFFCVFGFVCQNEFLEDIVGEVVKAGADNNSKCVETAFHCISHILGIVSNMYQSCIWQS